MDRQTFNHDQTSDTVLLRRSLLQPAQTWLAVSAPIEMPAIQPPQSPTDTPDLVPSYPVSNSSEEDEPVDLLPDLTDPALQPLHSPALIRRSTDVSVLKRRTSQLASFDDSFTSPFPRETDDDHHFFAPGDDHEEEHVLDDRYRLDSFDKAAFDELRKQIGEIHDQTQEDAEEEMAAWNMHQDMLVRLSDAIW